VGAGGIDLRVREPVTDAFWHEAVLYRDGVNGLLDTVLPFVAEGVERGEPVMVAEPPEAIAALQDALGAGAGKVTFVDIATLGRNPARIIPQWLRFVDELGQAGPVRGVGEPAYVGRRDVELDECRLHEALLNVAFDSGPAWKLMCPYDASALPAEVIDGALRTHPYVGDPEPVAARYAGHAYAMAEFTRPLPPPPTYAEEFGFDGADLCGLRSVVRRLCDQVALGEDRTDDLVLAAHELAGNSVQHAGGRGTMRAWRTETALVIEVVDTGVIDDLLVGREPVLDLDESGRGVSIANQLCDLVQVRSSAWGTTVRLHTWL
jgi:anti-sigma regulatory factor (Ser/Thr protein kinase)